MADECQKRVVIVDTSNEIGGDGDIPHFGVGGSRRMQVASTAEQHRIMIEAVEVRLPALVQVVSLVIASSSWGKGSGLVLVA